MYRDLREIVVKANNEWRTKDTRAIAFRKWVCQTERCLSSNIVSPLLIGVEKSEPSSAARDLSIAISHLVVILSWIDSNKLSIVSRRPLSQANDLFSAKLRCKRSFFCQVSSVTSLKKSQLKKLRLDQLSSRVTVIFTISCDPRLNSIAESSRGHEWQDPGAYFGHKKYTVLPYLLWYTYPQPTIHYRYWLEVLYR